MIDLDRDTVDIIIPARNESGTIEKCLLALANQNYPGSLIKIYVIDNGSTDDTSELARKHGVTLLSLKKGSIGAVRNLGIKAGKGTYLAFIDAHCLPDPNWLHQMITYLKSNHTDACQGVIEFEFSNSLLSTLCGNATFRQESHQRERCAGEEGIYPFFVTGNVVCTRASVEAVGLFDEALPRAEDLDLAWRLILTGYKLGYNPEGRVLHKNSEDYLSFYLKFFYTGRAVSQIYKKYELSTQSGRSLMALFNSRITTLWILSTLLSLTGYQLENIRQKLGIATTIEPFRPSVTEEFRPVFYWDSEMSMSLSRDIIFWQSWTNNFIVVNITNGHRFIFSESAAMIFQKLTDSASRETTVETLTKIYAADRHSIEGDIDEFMKHLLNQNIVVTQS